MIKKTKLFSCIVVCLFLLLTPVLGWSEEHSSFDIRGFFSSSLLVGLVSPLPQSACQNGVRTCSDDSQALGVKGVMSNTMSILFDHYSTSDEGYYSLAHVDLGMERNRVVLDAFYQLLASTWGSIEFGLVENVVARLSPPRYEPGIVEAPGDWSRGVHGSILSLMRTNDQPNGVWHITDAEGQFALVAPLHRPNSGLLDSFAPISGEVLASQDRGIHLNLYSPDNFYGFQLGFSYGLITASAYETNGSITGLTHYLVHKTPFERGLEKNLLHHFASALDFEMRLARKRKWRIMFGYALRTRLSAQGNQDLPLAQGYTLMSDLKYNAIGFRIAFTHNLNAVDAALGPDNCTDEQLAACLDSYVVDLSLTYGEENWLTGLALTTGITPGTYQRDRLLTYLASQKDAQNLVLHVPKEQVMTGMDFNLRLALGYDYRLSKTATFKFGMTYHLLSPAQEQQDTVLESLYPRHNVTFVTGLDFEF